AAQPTGALAGARPTAAPAAAPVYTRVRGTGGGRRRSGRFAGIASWQAWSDARRPSSTAGGRTTGHGVTTSFSGRSTAVRPPPPQGLPPTVPVSMPQPAAAAPVAAHHPHPVEAAPAGVPPMGGHAVRTDSPAVATSANAAVAPSLGQYHHPAYTPHHHHHQHHHQQHHQPLYAPYATATTGAPPPYNTSAAPTTPYSTHQPAPITTVVGGKLIGQQPPTTTLPPSGQQQQQDDSKPVIVGAAGQQPPQPPTQVTRGPSPVREVRESYSNVSSLSRSTVTTCSTSTAAVVSSALTGSTVAALTSSLSTVPSAASAAAVAKQQWPPPPQQQSHPPPPPQQQQQQPPGMLPPSSIAQPPAAVVQQVVPTAPPQIQPTAAAPAPPPVVARLTPPPQTRPTPPLHGGYPSAAAAAQSTTGMFAAPTLPPPPPAPAPVPVAVSQQSPIAPAPTVSAVPPSAAAPAVAAPNPNPFSAESLFQSGKYQTNQADMLRRELDNRFLASQDRSLGVAPPPYLRTEMHQHQHHHTHVHQHTSLLPPTAASSLYPSPLSMSPMERLSRRTQSCFKDIPKLGGVESPFYRQNLGLPGAYPGYTPGLIHPGLTTGPTPFVPPNHLPTFQPKSLTPQDPTKPRIVVCKSSLYFHILEVFDLRILK
ncbi:unnamed protein product, partial [Callosobruchus maculatus]